MQVKVQYCDWSTISKTANFTIIVVNPCLTDTLTIDETKFAYPALTYKVKDTAAVFSWTDSAATSVNGIGATCGAFTWTVTKIDGSAIDTIFTGAYTAATKTLSTYTTDFTQVAIY